MTIKILHLTLKKKWFDLIKSRQKKIEWREIKPYWTKRLENKTFDVIKFRNGYSKESPTIMVEHRGMIKGSFQGKECYGIKLGGVLSTNRNFYKVEGSNKNYGNKLKENMEMIRNGKKQ